MRRPGRILWKPDDIPRISRRSVEFFLDWLDAAQAEFADDEALLKDFAAARPYWEDLQARANAE